jgi:uncharacterized cupin superfamily protein
VSKPTSKTVQRKINNLYAALATAAAQKAVDSVVEGDDMADAGVWAETAGEWLIKAGAQAADWKYNEPVVKR